MQASHESFSVLWLIIPSILISIWFSIWIVSEHIRDKKDEDAQRPQREAERARAEEAARHAREAAEKARFENAVRRIQGDEVFRAEMARRDEEEKRRRIENANRKRTIEDLQSLSPAEFEVLVSDLFFRDGYGVGRCGRTGDEGIDIRLSLQGTTNVVQCKRWSKAVQAATMREFYGSLKHSMASHGFFVTTSSFTSGAEAFALGKPITLIDGRGVLAWIAGGRPRTKLS